MLQTLAYGGIEKGDLFQAAIGSSPYLPMQWGYDEYPTTACPPILTSTYP